MDHKVLFLSLPRGPQPQIIIRRRRRAVNRGVERIHL